ncbi:MAG: hypothetical protein ACLS4A_00330 [Oscillospiraceae bacterium]
MFASGDLAFFWDLESQTASFVQASSKGEAFLDEIGAFPIPGATAGQSVGYVSDVVLVVFKSCKNMEAAGVVAEFLGGEDTIQIMFDYGKGKMSSRTSVMDHVFANVESEFTAAYVEAMKQCRSCPLWIWALRMLTKPSPTPSPGSRPARMPPLSLRIWMPRSERCTASNTRRSIAVVMDAWT